MLGLLIGTAAAFAITEKLKLEKSPITGTFVSSAFSPVCGCARDKANISVKFRNKDTVTVVVLTAGRKPVRTLVEATPVQRGRNIFRWDGKTDAGTQAPDGTYRVQIHLAKAHRTILLPNTIELDTKTPVVIPMANRTEFSPDGDHQADSVTIHFTLSEPAHVLVYLGDRLLIRSRSHTTQRRGHLVRAGSTRHLHPPGTVTLSVGAVDLAGNADSRRAAAAGAGHDPLHHAREPADHGRGGQAVRRSASRRTRGGTAGRSADATATRTGRCCDCARRSSRGATSSWSRSTATPTARW